jgi:hypothetical protein
MPTTSSGDYYDAGGNNPSSGGGSSSGGSSSSGGASEGQVGQPTGQPTSSGDYYDSGKNQPVVAGPGDPGYQGPGTPTGEPTDTPTAVPGDGDGDGIPDSERQPGGSGTPGDPTGESPTDTTTTTTAAAATEPTEAEKRAALADQYREDITAVGDAAKTQGAEQTAAIQGASDAAKVDYEGLGTAAGDVFLNLQNKYADYANKTASELNKTTEETLEAGRKYASGAAQEDALRTSNLAVQQAYKAAKTAGMLPGQAALVAAQEVGGAFSDTFTKQLQAYDAEYATANTTRRQEIEAEAQKALEGMQTAQTQQKEITDAKVASAYEGLSQMTQAQQESLNQQLDSLIAAQSGDISWAGLSIQEKIAELQAKAQSDENASNWLDKIIGGIGAIAGILI